MFHVSHVKTTKPCTYSPTVESNAKEEFDIHESNKTPLP